MVEKAIAEGSARTPPLCLQNTALSWTGQPQGDTDKAKSQMRKVLSKTVLEELITLAPGRVAKDPACFVARALQNSEECIPPYCLAILAEKQVCY